MSYFQHVIMSFTLQFEHVAWISFPVLVFLENFIINNRSSTLITLKVLTKTNTSYLYLPQQWTQTINLNFLVFYSIVKIRMCAQENKTQGKRTGSKLRVQNHRYSCSNHRNYETLRMKFACFIYFTAKI